MLQEKRISINMFAISMVLFSGDVERALRGAQPPLLKFRGILGAQSPFTSEFIFGWTNFVLATLYFRFLDLTPLCNIVVRLCKEF